MKIGKPRVKAKEIRRQEIQEAARKVFFKKGYQNSTIAEIAKLAGIREGTIYLYFKNKEDLYISLMIPLVEKISEKQEQMKGAISNNRFKNASELMDAQVKDYLDLFKYDSEGLRIIQTFQLGNLFVGMSKMTRKKLDNLAHQNFQCFRRIVSLAKDLGLIKEDVNEFLLCDVLWATFLGVVQLEESKSRVNNKSHLASTLKYAFSLITKGITR